MKKNGHVWRRTYWTSIKWWLRWAATPDATSPSAKPKTSPSNARPRLKKFIGNHPTNTGRIFQWLGGYFTKLDATDLGLALDIAHHIFRSRTINGLYREVRTIHTLLTHLNLALPVDRPSSQSPFTAKDLREEVASLWDAETLVQQRRYQSILGEESQKLAGLLQVMASHTNDKIIGDYPQSRQLGKRQPENELEALRWISGYFARTHERRPGT